MSEHKMGGSWGNRIDWWSWDARRVVGWKTPRPVVGDIIRAQMVSGKIGLFEIVTVEYEHDPPDMFFATVRDLGYGCRREGEVSS